MQRAPAPSKNFVRGKSGHVPFWPGGLEEALGDIDDEVVASGKSYGLRTIPPGFTRGLRLPGEEGDVDDLERMEEDGDDGVTQLRPVIIRSYAPISLAYLHYRGLLERSPH
jgi:antiviral helicase SKI2